MDRRKVLKGIGMSAALSSFNLPILKASNTEDSLKIAHITDVHIRPDKEIEAQFSRCLHHIQSNPVHPEVIFNGGDCIGDALKRSKSEVKKQWEAWNGVIKNDRSLKMINCIGNHDVWGAGDRNDKLYGKNWAQDELSLDRPYYSYDSKGWHIIVLDSTHTKSDDSWYTAQLDEAQFEWLKKDLSAVSEDTHVMVFSHIPILAACAFFDGDNEKSGDWIIPGAWVHIDARKIVELFYQYPQVKLCISGHIHLLDEVIYNGVTYMCNGAVSGNWWKPTPYHQTDKGYSLIELYPNGAFSRRYVNYQV
ncbi:MAG: metallophosphoesterase family protein [Cyclobacteriaceae bacterium]